MPCFAPRCLPEAYLYYNTSTEAVPSFQVASKRRKNTTAAHFLDVPHSLSQSGVQSYSPARSRGPRYPRGVRRSYSWRAPWYATRTCHFSTQQPTQNRSRDTQRPGGCPNTTTHRSESRAGLHFWLTWGFLPLQIGTYATQVLWARSVLLTSPVIATCGLSLTIPVAMATDSVSDRTLCLCAALSSQVRAKSAEQTRRCQ